MLTAINSKKELVNVQATDEGEIKVAMGNMPTSENGNVKVEMEESETTLKAEVLEVGTEPTTVEIGKKVTGISIANYSETASIIANIGGEDWTIGSNLAVDLSINKDVENLSLSSTEEATKIQYVVKGVE